MSFITFGQLLPEVMGGSNICGEALGVVECPLAQRGEQKERAGRDAWKTMFPAACFLQVLDPAHLPSANTRQ